ncbi:MAG: glycoside hydrolase family 3 C-terminal domain-containing protein [Spirochaetia bacterium]|nr:glycoside hydrolase family 3 C-terminal domain-containing protein [Spirochaetia bacterium]
MKWLRFFNTPTKPLGKDGKKVSGCVEHIELSKNTAAEGIVLLKNQNNVLPLKNKKIVLLGKASEEYVKGGGGSGDVYCQYCTSLYEAFKSAEGIELYEGLHDFYQENLKAQRAKKREPGMTSEPELSGSQIKAASEFSDTAILSINRYSGEGWDRACSIPGKELHMENIEVDVWGGEDAFRAMSKEVFPKGDFYLTTEEENLVKAAEKNFKNVIVLLNVGGVIDTSWFAENPKIQSVLFLGQGGMEGAKAAVEILLGKKNPSGKLTDTFAKRLEDYPSTETFHDFAGGVEYQEDIFVGYRYFETIPGKKDCVVYPFGYGLSYTDFEINLVGQNDADEKIAFTIKVKNTGKVSGKEVVQLYYSAPEGKLTKPKLILGGFKKTKELKPGESCFVETEIEKNNLASYDDEGAVKKSAWVLEKGDYKFYYGNSIRNVKETETPFTVKETEVVLQLTEQLKPKKLTKRLLADGTYKNLETSEYEKIQRPELFKKAEVLEGVIPSVRGLPYKSLVERFHHPAKHLQDVADGKVTMEEFMAQLSEEDLVWLLGGQPNTGTANTFGIGNNFDYDIPNVMTADGPAGIRIMPWIEQYTTAWPCATTLACTWNEDAVEKIGEAVAKEVKENNCGIYLAPGLNIHRSPLCGRNFEYYSEDPLVSGIMASAAVKGIQSQGIAATPKHFAFNNKETNRKQSDSIVSERAAREVYLKSFEYVVKNAGPWAIMSSYNMVNGQHTSECKDLLTNILRKEWAYKGMVMTDWWTRAEHWREVKAGNDVKMACGYPEQLLEALKDGCITIDEVKTSARRVLEMILKLD